MKFNTQENVITREEETCRPHLIFSIDVLRILACLAVIILHVGAAGLDEFPRSANWEIRNVYRSIVCWCVPCFVMISGAMFLDQKRKISLRRLYRHNILRMAVAYVVWALAYLLAEYDGDMVPSHLITRFAQGVCICGSSR